MKVFVFPPFGPLFKNCFMDHEEGVYYCLADQKPLRMTGEGTVQPTSYMWVRMLQRRDSDVVLPHHVQTRTVALDNAGMN